MRTSCWNCRGLGTDSTVRSLKEINRKYLPDILCLSETKQQADYVRDVGAQLGFPFSVVVPPVGVEGGLVIFFEQSVQLSVVSQSSHLIDCKVAFNGMDFNFSFVYGHPNPSLRHYTWDKLIRLSLLRRHEPWFLLGDFNEILGNHEKDGGRTRPEGYFHEFRQMMRTCELVDLQSIGDRFSWVGQRGTHLVKCCLDRTMANMKWLEMFPASQTEFLEIGESDQRPLVTYITSEREDPRRCFRFDSRMIAKEGFTETVRRGWKGTGQVQLIQIPLVQRLSRCRQHISRWKRHHRTNAEERIGTLRAQLDRAVTSATTSQERRIEIREELNQAYVDEEIYWKQKSRVNWLRSGDRNTRYFHAVTKGKRIKNTISVIQDESGVIHRGHKEISQVAVKYFQDLYTSGGTNTAAYGEVFQDFQPRVTLDMNQDLTRMITEEEVYKAVMDIGAHRAPGPEGFTDVFYHNYWAEIKDDVMKEITKFFETGHMDPQLSHTNLCLIPKIYPQV